MYRPTENQLNAEMDLVVAGTTIGRAMVERVEQGEMHVAMEQVTLFVANRQAEMCEISTESEQLGVVVLAAAGAAAAGRELE